MSKKDDGTSQEPKKSTAKPTKNTKSFLAHFSKKHKEEYDASVEEAKKMLSSIATKGNRKKVHTDAQEAYYEKKSKVCKQVMEEAKKAAKPLVGRPTLYSEELADYIVDKVASSAVGLKQMCSDDDMMPDHSTVNLWRWKYPEFSARYQLAKQHQTYLMGEDCEEIAKEVAYISDPNGSQKVDPGFIASRRLIVDTKKWHASKLAPTIFGDRKAVEALQNENEQLKAELMEQRTKLQENNKKEY